MMRALRYLLTALAAVAVGWWWTRPPADVRVELSPDGVLTVAGERVELPRLEPELTRIVGEHPRTTVVIVAPASMPASQLMPVIDAARAAGIDRVEFEAQP
ncbi:MAG: biopolymer transporter ExbD [Sinimarinibacterium sp.]|jgi:biopolymer transport protein ExbD